MALCNTKSNSLKLETQRNLATVTKLSFTDEKFVNNVSNDIGEFLKRRHINGVLLFPPVNSFRRFLIHQTCENFQEQNNLFTFSVGQGSFRRTVVCFVNQLLDPTKFTNNLEKQYQSPVKSWRSNQKSKDSTTNTHQTKRYTNSEVKMGVEKNFNDSSRSNKTTHTVDIYRPPALRRNLKTIDSNDATTIAPKTTTTVNATLANSDSNISPSLLTTTTTSVSCNNSPNHANEDSNFSNSVTSTNILKLTTATNSTTTISSGQQRQQQQQTTRRERRPDRAVYIPRARRSQTTPPTTTTQSPATLTTAAIATTMVTTTTASSLTVSTTTMNNNVSNNQQLTITNNIAALVSTAPSSKVDEQTKITSKSKSKISASVNKDRKERVKKSTAIIVNESGEGGGGVHKGNSAQIKKSSKLLENSEPPTVILIAQSETNDYVARNRNCDNNCDQQQPQQQYQHQKSTDIRINKIENFEQSKFNTAGRILAQANTTNDMDTINHLRIEDIVSNENKRTTPKCDIDEQELQRASKEINRSNRRIIKQTFVSDVLEIPEKIEKISKKNVISVPAIDFSTDNGEEEDEDDWENMFDETGECLDPKILEELTASVGKVKIELPKMDYSAYLENQTILNEEEFPHVLEVSNFPVEFKNQDLLMLFSEYKESGFDIKWVDDTHALAVFSSSRIAAEVLTMGHPFVVLKPLAEATVESRLKAKRCAASLQPYRQRPKTCAALARRLVTGALGVRLKTAAAERESEKQILREAKERKLLAAKERDEAWES